jgi:hypothetical protein
MKKIFASLLLILLITYANGQETRDHQIGIGIKSGITIANQTWKYKSIDLTQKKDNIVGLYEGVCMEIQQKKGFVSSIMDFAYYQKGFTDKIPNITATMPEGDGTYRNISTKFNYLLIGVNWKARYEKGHFVPYALLGVRNDIMLSYKSDLDYHQIDTNFRKLIWGLNFGGGLQYRSKDVGVFVEGQYYYDFTSVMNLESNSNTSVLEINNNSYSICLGLKYFIHIKKKKEAAK